MSDGLTTRCDREYEFHPLADLFPLMSDEEIDALGEDMLKNAQREPIWLYEGMILDGRNRYKACLLKGIEPRFAEYRCPDPLAFVTSANLHRRHLDESQRAMVAAKLANMRRGDNQHKTEGRTSQAKAAELLDVSPRSVGRAREVIDHGVPDLVDAVERGEVPIAPAAEFAKQPKEDQAKQIAEAGSPVDAVKVAVRRTKAVRLIEFIAMIGNVMEDSTNLTNLPPMSGDQRTELMAQITRANAKLNELAIAVASAATRTHRIRPGRDGAHV
jgi:hypothetical protein